MSRGSYDENGNIKGTMEMKPPIPSRLQWDFSDPEFQATVEEAYIDAQKIIDVSKNKSLNDT